MYSEMLDDFERNPRHYSPEERTLHNHSCGHLNAHIRVIPSSPGSQIKAVKQAASKEHDLSKRR
jgi:hypothetical protein